MMSALFPKLSFCADETPMPWAARQAAFHTGGRLGPFLNDLGIPVVDLAKGKIGAVERLCTVAGQDPTKVLVNNIMAIGKRRFRLRGEEFSSDFTTGAETRFCSMRLGEDISGHGDPRIAMRHRLYWRIAPIRTCPLHFMPLHVVRGAKWNDAFHELQAMDQSILGQQTVASPEVLRKPSPLRIYVEQRLQGASGPVGWILRRLIRPFVRPRCLGGYWPLGLIKWHPQ